MSRFKNGKGQFSLGHTVREFLLITLSIYLAFVVNNWNETKKEKQLEEFYLNNLLEDVNSCIGILEYQISLSNTHKKYSIKLDSLLDLGQAADKKFLRLYLNAFNQNPPFIPVDYSYKSLLQSGDYRILSDQNLRNELDKYFLEILPSVVSAEGYLTSWLAKYFAIKEDVYVVKTDQFLNIEKLFTLKFKDIVFSIPVYVNQEIGQLQRALDSGILLKQRIEETIGE